MSREQRAAWQGSFNNYRTALTLELGRNLTAGEVVRAKNCYSQRVSPSALATLIRAGRQR